jgi:hypothetical protein
LKSASGNQKNGANVGPHRWAEPVRWVLILGLGLWLSRPFFTARNLGTGDAMWNAVSLADAVTQFRAGVFPVFVGQSSYQFNGSVYPFRVAPYYLYLGGLLDLLTGHRLDFVTLEHLTAVASLLGGLVSAYLCLLWLAPRRRWTALLLAFLYVSCPGVMGLVYAQDLYMSTMAIPWVPLALAGALRSFDDSGPRPFLVAAAGLAGLWWAHAPIAMWTMSAMAPLFIVRMVLRWRAPRLWAPAVSGAVAFTVLAAYPFISAFLLRTPGQQVVPYTLDRSELLTQLADAFPACVLPIDLAAPPLTHLQVGYALALTMALAMTIGARWRRAIPLGISFAVCAFLLVLLYPIPGLTAALWRSLPESVVGLTLYWPMQRLCIVIAGLAVASAQFAFARLPEAGPWPRTICALLLLGAIWSTREANRLLQRADRTPGTAAQTEILMRPENAAIQRHSYHLLPPTPAYMSNGVMDPAMEARLIDRQGRIIATDFDGVPVPESAFGGHVDANPGILDLEPTFTLQPGVRYALTFEFLAHDYTGVLQIVGPAFFREYPMPASGKPFAFGVDPSMAKSVSLWTSGTEPETVQLRFIPTAPNAHPADFAPFARYSFCALDSRRMPVRLESLIPYRATITAKAAALLESPRLYIPGYVATVNGRPNDVARSPQGLVAVRVPAGVSAVEIAFRGAPILHLAFWVSSLGWTAAVAAAGVLSWRRLRSTQLSRP